MLVALAGPLGEQRVEVGLDLGRRPLVLGDLAGVLPDDFGIDDFRLAGRGGLRRPVRLSSVLCPLALVPP
jgi:hypothetical protein